MIRQKITRSKLEQFLTRWRSEGLTLDVGSGNSPYSRYFRNRVGIDVRYGNGVHMIADAHALPFRDGSFDLILCTEVLEHLQSPHIAISEFRRVLKQGGLLILTTRFIFPIHDGPHDFYRFTQYGLRYLLSEGWNIEELAEESDVQDTLAVLIQRICYQTHVRGGKLLKVLLLLVAYILRIGPRFIRQEFVDISRRQIGKFMTSGYYVVARKQ